MMETAPDYIRRMASYCDRTKTTVGKVGDIPRRRNAYWYIWSRLDSQINVAVEFYKSALSKKLAIS
jgi:hypothetical protein